MAKIYWLTEAGEVEPQPVCNVDFSDEGAAVEYGHHLYRTSLKSAGTRQGFVIKNDVDDVLYTWRWTGAIAEPVPLEELPPTQEDVASHAYVPSLLSVRDCSDAILGSILPGFASGASARPQRREQADHVSDGTGIGEKLGALVQLAPVAWRSLTRWERPSETVAPRRFPPAAQPESQPLKTRRAG